VGNSLSPTPVAGTLVAMAERDVSVAGFVGREAEMGVIAAAAEAAAGGRPQVVWVEGEAGSGKTALVRQAAAALPAGFSRVRVQSDELAADIPYELAGQLGAANIEGPFVAGMSVLDAWSTAQDGGPVAVLVEDFHWADAASSQALLSAARRLDQDRLVVILTSRFPPDQGWDRFLSDSDRCCRLVLADFDVDEVAALAAATGVELTHRQAVRLHAHTGGHPLYVRTMLGELSANQLRSAEGDLPAPRSLASAVTARLSELPEASRHLAEAMAVINQRSPLPMVAQVADVGAPIAPFEFLLETGFVRWDASEPGPPVEFAHPLYRQAVYQDLSPTRRRDLHRAAAGVLTPAAVLAHRVAAADGVDAGLADELEAAGRRGMAEGSPGPGARNLLWASSLSATPEQVERRLLQAVRALLDSRQTTQAAARRDQLEACQDSAGRSLLLGMMDWERGEAGRAERWLRKAAIEGADSDPVDAGWAWAQLGEIYATEGRADDTIDAAQRALALAPDEPRIERLAWIGLAMGEGLRHGAAIGLDRLRQRLPQPADEVPDAEASMLVTRGTLGLYAGRTVDAIGDHRAVLRSARRAPLHSQIARCHFQLATLLINSGDWDEALVQARTALSIASDYEQVWIEAQCHAVLATVVAYRGEWELAERQIAVANELAGRWNSAEGLITARIAAAALGRAQDRPHSIIEALGDLPPLTPMVAALTFWPTLIVALIDGGQLGRADELIGLLDEAAKARGLDFAARLASLRARLAAARGLADEAAARFEESLRLFDADDPYLDRALTHQAFGRLLRARGDRRHAVDELRTAHQLLSSVGADPFVARVDEDLTAAGIRAAAKTHRSTLELTDRERDVAVLVAQGLTNPEVAAQLYISRKAVEYHLRNTYGKLGISSRRELRTAEF
jgi:DNA-binding NarL/FixJ family response regulator/Tfp pilus assembly protein PilF